MRTFRAFLLLLLATELAISCSPPGFKIKPERDGSCSDGTQNGDETGTDCGGSECSRCDLGDPCDTASDCEIFSCVNRVCQTEGCVDNLISGDETDVDCGGPSCKPCGVRQRCETASDCKSNSCADGECVAAGCDDGRAIAPETDVDCGGGTCPACGFGNSCTQSGDCTTGFCGFFQCTLEHCLNGLQDGAEEGVDCGGDCARRCDDQPCTGDDCDPCADDPTAPGCEPGTGGAGGVPSVGGAPDMPGGGEPGETGGSGPGTGGTGNGEGGTLGAGGSQTPDAGSSQGGDSSGGTPPTGGSGNGGAGAPSGGNATGGGATNPLTSCPGCARLQVPLERSADQANFVLFLPGETNFSSAVLRLRFYKESGIGGQFKAYVQHARGFDFELLFSPPTLLRDTEGWQELRWDVGAHQTPFDKTIVARVGVQIIGTGSTQWSDPTIVYLDWILVENVGAGPWNFMGPGSVLTSPATSANAGQLFINNGDSPVPGARLSWLGPDG